VTLPKVFIIFIRDLKMSKKPLLTLFSFALASCAQTPSQPYEVKRESLFRSMVYTQRELLALKLKEDSPVNSTRYTALFNSYCDLAERKAFATQAPGKCLQSSDRKTRQCAALFYRCIDTCDVLHAQCLSCETKATNCLTEDSENEGDY